MTLSTDPTELKIALLEARQRELLEARKTEVLDIDGLPEEGLERLDAAAGRLLALLPVERGAFMLELRRRAALAEAMKAEYLKAEEELQLLRQAKAHEKSRAEAAQRRAKAAEQETLTPSQFARGMAWLLLIAGTLVGTGAGIDALAGNRAFGARHAAALATGYLACLGAGEVKRIRRPGRKNNGPEAGK